MPYPLLLAAALALAAGPALGITVYKYRDASGVVSFTDQPTAGAQVLFYDDAYEERLEDQVRVVKEVAGERELLFLRNDLAAPVEVELRLEELVNVAGAPAGPLRQVVPARSRVQVASLGPAGPGAMRYQHSLRYAISAPGGAAGDGLYALPWSGGPFVVSQGPEGQYSHQTELNRYAVDVAMPEGTPVLAARAGVVVKAEDRHGEGGGGRNGNYVRLLHDDGSMSVYLHLQRASLRVAEGDRVQLGQRLAASGNSGSTSTGAHLHFVVQRNLGLRVASVPFRFSLPGGVAMVPRQGQSLGGPQVAAAEGATR